MKPVLEIVRIVLYAVVVVTWAMLVDISVQCVHIVPIIDVSVILTVFFGGLTCVGGLCYRIAKIGQKEHLYFCDFCKRSWKHRQVRYEAGSNFCPLCNKGVHLILEVSIQPEEQLNPKGRKR